MVQEMIPNSMMIGCLAGHVDAGITAHVLKLLALLTMMTVFCVPTVSELFTLCTICSTIVHRRSLTETFGGRAIGLGLVTTCFIGVQRQSLVGGLGVSHFVHGAIVCWLQNFAV